MKKLLYILLFVPLAFFGQCELPPSNISPVTGNTMTIGIWGDFLNESIEYISDSIYFAFYNSYEQLINSNKILNVTCNDNIIEKNIQNGEMITNLFTVYTVGDDNLTPEIDGPQNDDEIILKIINGSAIYELDTEIIYAAGDIFIIHDGNLNLVCSGLNYGCMDPNALNFNDINGDGLSNQLTGGAGIDINTDDGSCIERVYGCLDNDYIEYNNLANTDDGSCQVLYDVANAEVTQENINLNNTIEEATTILSSLQQALDTWNTTIDLSAGWNMFGYGCPTSIDLVQGLSNHTELIAMVKDNNGSAYIPEFDFNGIGDLTPGFGYQIKVTEAIEGFSLCDWYVNDIPEDNIVSLQEENLAFRDSLIYLLNNNCIHEGYCGYNEDDNACYYPNQGYDCDGNFIPQIGHEVMGGILFYYDEDLNRGLIVAQEDIDTFAPWGCFGFNVDGLNSSIGSGLNNSILITQQCDETPNAAQLCLEYEYSGYSDWYLPSYEELLLMWSSVGQGAQYIGNVSNFNDGGYWSSNQQNITDAKFLFFDHFDAPYYITNYSKGVTLRVRPIRSFGNWTMGCMDSIACNFNPDANMTDGSCEYPELGYDCEGNITAEIGDYINYCSDIYSNISFNQSELNEYLENRNLFIYNPSPSASTFLFSPDFINSLNIINQNAFLVAFNDSIQISLPATLVEEELQSGQQAVYVYQLGEIDDGLYVESNLILPNDILTFKFINGNILYDIIIDPVPTFLNSGNLNPYLNTVGYPVDFDFAYGVYPSYAFGDSCLLTNVGCTDSTYIEYLSLAVIDDGSCLTLIVEGCMDSRACNYNPEANMSDASCEYPILGYDCDGNSLEYFVGMEAEGGIVFYVDETGEHGLVAALEDLGIFEWGCYGIDVNMTGYGYSNTLGTGYQNTLDIVSQGCETENGGVTAAQASLDAEISGYNDWYLPSIDELNEMYSTIGLGGIYGNIGGYEINDSPFYWSSSDDYIYSAYTVYFIDGFSSTNNGNRSNTNWVRVIRAF